MRELTVAEYRTILSILAHPGETEQSRIQVSKLPSSTYNVVRRRAYEEGWLSDVMVPSPGACGYAGVDFRLSRPSLSARAELVRCWADDPGCVLLWSGVHAVFGIFFRVAPPPPDEAAEDLPGVFRVFAGRGSGTIPAYFDSSGLWARYGREPEPPSYPGGLDLEAEPAERRALSGARDLLSEEAGADPPYRWTNLARLPRSPRRVVENRVVESKTLLNLARLPPWDGRRIGELVFVQGRVRPGSTARDLFGALLAECGVFPFLFAEAGGRILLVGVGQTRSAGPVRVPVASARQSVMTMLTEHLDPAEVLIEPVEAIDERVRHRYPRTVPALLSRSTDHGSPPVNPV